MPVRVEYDGKKLELMVPQSAGVILFQRWTHHALAAFIASHAFQKIHRLNYFHRNEYSSCLRQADTVKRVAECAENIIENEKSKNSTTENKRSIKKSMARPTTVQIKADLTTKSPSLANFSHSKTKLKSSLKRISESHLRHHSHLPKKVNGTLRRVSPKTETNITPLIKHVKNSKNEIMKRLNTRRILPPLHLRKGDIWGDVEEKRSQREEEKRNDSWVSKLRPKRTKREVISKSDYELLNEDAGRSPLGIFARSLRNLLHEIKHMASDDMSSSNGVQNSAINASTASTNYGPKRTFEALSGPLKLIGEGIKLGLMATEQNSTEEDVNTMRSNLRSDPDDMPISRGARVEDIDLKPFLKSRPIKNIDQRELLRLLVEVSEFENKIAHKDIATHQKKSKEMSPSTEMPPHMNWVDERGLRGQPLYFTKNNISDAGNNELLVIEIFEKLHGSIEADQVKELNTIGYSVLTKAQLKLIYGSQSPYHNREFLQQYGNIDAERLQRYVEKDIQLLSKMESLTLVNNDANHNWTLSVVPSLQMTLENDEITLTEPSVLAPLVLSPIVMFPCVLGPFLLNPWIFSPILTSAIINAPLILRPQKFPPLFFSPLVYRPNIMTFGIVKKDMNPDLRFSPIVLPLDSTPILLLSKLIINPDVFSNSSDVTATFSEQGVNLSAQFIHSLMFPHGISSFDGQIPSENF
ncbi:unnamed protein product [Toxocara canis]|nr:unnamed protein product [Toxocara canis]